MMNTDQERKFSQNNEQFVIERLFKEAGITTGRILDIGAYHPETFSNSRSLIDKGWSAVLVEPSPGPFQALLNHYHANPNVQLLNAAVAREWGIVEFYDSGGDAISTTSVAHMQKWEQGWKTNFKKFLLYTVPLGVVLGRCGYDFEFINIDVEDANWELFREVPFQMMPKLRVLCIEHDGFANVMRHWCSSFGFKQAAMNGENLILAR